MSGYDFHPEAAVDLEEIWEFIAADNLDAAVVGGSSDPRSPQPSRDGCHIEGPGVMSFLPEELRPG